MAYVQKSTTDSYVATERLFLTADKERVVLADDPAAAFLLAHEGSEVPVAEVERLGLARKQAAPEATKQAPAPANKQTAPAANKARR